PSGSRATSEAGRNWSPSSPRATACWNILTTLLRGLPYGSILWLSHKKRRSRAGPNEKRPWQSHHTDSHPPLFSRAALQNASDPTPIGTPIAYVRSDSVTYEQSV